MPTFSFFELHTPDLDRAKAFYGALLDWKFDDLPMPGPRFALATQGGALSGGMREDPRPSWLNYVTVEDCSRAAERARALGATLVQPRTEVPGAGAFVVIADPLGATFALWEEAR